MVSDKKYIAFIDYIFPMLIHEDYMKRYLKGSKDKFVQIDKYLDRLEQVFLNCQKNDKIDLLRKYFYKQFVIKPEDIPEGYLKNEIIESQKESLDEWINFLFDNKRKYPTWMKYWIFASVVKMGSYNSNKETYSKRTNKTMAPFVDVNKYIIDECRDYVISYINSDSKDSGSIINFNKLYSHYEQVYKQYNEVRSRGKWIKYKENCLEDAKMLSKSLKNKNTHWCTMNEDDAIAQICGSDKYKSGDFYVYYSSDKNGEYTVPRLAIRLHGSSIIAEIRGIEGWQNVEDNLIKILFRKLDSIPNIDIESKKLAKETILYIKKLKKIRHKTITNVPLTQKEYELLYLEYMNFNFGVDLQPNDIIMKRNVIQDIDKIKSLSIKKEIELLYVTLDNVEYKSSGKTRIRRKNIHR